MRTQEKQGSKKIVALIIGLLVILLALIGWGYYENINNNFNQNYDNSGNTALADKKLKVGKPISILLMGTDTGALGRNYTGRTDSMIVATINPNSKQTTFTSIPRDTKVKIDGDMKPYQKINAAYEIGGSEQAKNTVSELLNIPIDYYATVNMHGIKQMVDAVGGVDITPKMTFDYEGISVKKGKTQHMDGFTALQYSRMRYQDPLGDYGRQIRQRQVLEAILLKAAKISSVSHYQSILMSLHGNLRTDLSFNDMILLGSKYREALHNFRETALQGQSATVDGLSYQVISDNELLKNTNEIRSSLDLPEVSHLSREQKKVNSNKEIHEGDSENDIFENGESVDNNAEIEG